MCSHPVLDCRLISAICGSAPLYSALKKRKSQAELISTWLHSGSDPKRESELDSISALLSGYRTFLSAYLSFLSKPSFLRRPSTHLTQRTVLNGVSGVNTFFAARRNLAG